MPSSKSQGVVTYLAILCSLLTFGCAAVPERASNACSTHRNAIYVDTRSSTLSLCQEGIIRQSFDVAFGRNGTGKRAVGDDKTPLGQYELGMPRPSNKGFHTFIPVEYPTSVQRSQGATGGDIGIHAAHDDWRWLGPLTTWINWTEGCIAVATVKEITEIAEWVKRFHVNNIIIS